MLNKHMAGLPAAELCRKHGISDATTCPWCEKQSGMKVSENCGRIAIQVFDQKYGGFLEYGSVVQVRWRGWTGRPGIEWEPIVRTHDAVS